MSDQQAHDDRPAAANPAVTVWLWLLVAFLLYRLVKYLLYAFDHITFPFDYDAGEGLILSRAWILAQGGNVYSPITEEPYFVMNYPPVFEGLVALMIKIFGPGHWIGRLLSVISALLAGRFIFGIVRYTTQRALPAAFAGLLFFASCWLTTWSVISRIDVFGLMCVLAGLLMMTRAMKMDKAVMVIAGAVLFSLALFTRQSLIAAPLACALTYMFSFRNISATKRGHKILFLSVMILFPAILFAVLTWITHGEFYRHTVIYTMGDFDFGNFIRWMKEFMNLHGVLVGLSLVYALVCWRKERHGMLVLFWFLALAVSLTAGKEGSSINYFLEFWAATCILAGLMVSDFEKMSATGGQRVLGPIVVGIIFVQVLILHYRTDFNSVRDNYREAAGKLAQYIRESPGEVLAEYTGYLVLNKKQPIYQPFSMTQLAQRGMWDEEVLIRDIQQRRFSLIVMSNVGMAYDRWSAPVQAAVNAHYDVKDSLACYELSYYHSTVNGHIVYKPKKMVTE